MGRIRTIKPEFWTDEDLSELPPETHLLAAALLNYADDEGYFNANHKLIKAQCAPLREDSTSVQRSLDELARIGYIALGVGEDGKRYGHIRTFREHQKIDRPKKSKIAAISITWDSSKNDRRSFDDLSTNDQRGKGTGNWDQGTGNGEQGTGRGSGEGEAASPPSSQLDASEALANGSQDASDATTTTELVNAVYEYWKWKMDKPRAKLTDERRKKIKARVREGYAFETFQRAIDACARSPFHNGENDKGNAYQDLTLICRTGSKLEWFCDDLHAKTPRRPGEETIEEFKERGKAQGDRILASGILDDLRSDSEPSSSGATYEHE